VITLKVDDGYHINANSASFDDLIPISLVFDRSMPAIVDYPKAGRFKSVFAPDGLDVYEGSATLIAAFPKAASRDKTISAERPRRRPATPDLPAGVKAGVFMWG
jgi:hypothetical protein